MRDDKAALPGAGGSLTDLDTDALGFVAEMYAVQLDQLAALLADRGEPAGSAADRARAAVARWRAIGHADSGPLSVGEPWVWATRKGLEVFGLESTRVRPTTTRLRHTHAVTEVRLAVERTAAYRDGGAAWRSERRIRTLIGFPPRDEHVPDGEVSWPADSGLPWAGQAWAIEVELSRKPAARIVAIMREALTRSGDYGCPPASIPPASSAAPGLPPRCARMVYVCSEASVRTVLKSRAELALPLAARVEVYDLPESAMRLNTPKRGWEP
jgi:hypothetical protein